VSSPDPDRDQSPNPTEAPTRVATALRELEGLDDRSLAEHADVFQGVHAVLQAALADIDDA
jgi:hypothetical protein